MVAHWVMTCTQATLIGDAGVLLHMVALARSKAYALEDLTRRRRWADWRDWLSVGDAVGRRLGTALGGSEG